MVPKYEFEIETVKKRIIELEAKDLDDAREKFEDLIKNDLDSKYCNIWDIIYKGEIIDDEQIIEIKHDDKALIRKGTILWES